ncbi:hypothetical protein [Carnobacterium divergens]|uniref:hypothetical protein n=1 Tax=Carnobacterium divergens TaxID=2748 RepID=UPI001072D3EF|nr:hypothetical protein [Carnobacterium divergens]TFI70424.1 hypothetical protein CKN81_09590 [Carnobacterium divergens]
MKKMILQLVTVATLFTLATPALAKDTLDLTFKSTSSATKKNVDLAVKTNLPKDTKIQTTVEGPKEFKEKFNLKVDKKGFVKQAFKGKKYGTYKITYATQVAKKQPSSVQKKLGKNGSNLTGKFVYKGTGTYAEKLTVQKGKKQVAVKQQSKNEKLINEQKVATATAKKKAKAEKIAKEQLEVAVKAVELAEATPTRENYDKANTLVASLSQKNKGLSDRLTTVNSAILASEKAEADRLAAEKKAEEDRLAAEKAEADRVANEQKEAARVAAEQAQLAEANRIANEQAQAAQAAQTPVGNTVYVTNTGHRYHASPNCRGLNNANSTRSATLEEAQNRGLTPCKFCY